MNLTKWLRKRTKTLLLIFMSFLLIAFLLPQTAFEGGGGRAGNPQVGVAFGEPVYAADMNHGSRVLDVVRALGFSIPPELTQLDMYLLIEEAHRAGIQFGREYASEQIDAAGITGQQMLEVQQRLGLSYQTIYDYAGDYMAAALLASLQGEAITLSEPRLQGEYQYLSEDANVDVSILLARAFLDQVPTPTEEEIVAQFEAGKDRETAHTDDALVFGYRQPPRVLLEYITVSPVALLDETTVLTSEARAFFEANRERYTKAVPDPNDPNQTTRVQLTLDEEGVLARVKEDVRVRKAPREALSTLNKLANAARQPWLAPTGPDGFVPAPAAEDQRSLADLVSDYATATEVQYHAPEWYSLEELAAVPGLGGASIAVTGDRRLSAPALAFRTKGLYEPQEGEQAPVLNIGQPSKVLVGPVPGGMPRNPQATQGYVIVVHDVRPAGPPASVDVVRTEVIDDLRNMRAYAMAQAAAEDLAARAREVGLRAAVESPETDPLRQDLDIPVGPPDPNAPPPPEAEEYRRLLGPQEAPQFTRSSQWLDTQLSPQPPGRAFPDLADRVFAIDDPNATPLAERVFVEGDPDRGLWVTAELKSINPLYEQEYEEGFQAARSAVLMQELVSVFLGPPQSQRERFQRQQLVMQLAQQPAARPMILGWWSSESIRTRTGWTAEGAPLP